MKPVLRFLAALILVLPLTAPAPSHAQSRSATLADAWSVVPHSALTMERASGFDLSFHSLTAARTKLAVMLLRGMSPDVPPLAIVAPRHAVDITRLADDLRENVGFDMPQVNHIVEFLVPPIRAHWYHLGTGASQNVGPALAARGYAQTAIEGLPMFTWGGDDFELFLAERATMDIFTGRVMQSARVIVDDDIVLAGTSTPFLSDAVDQRGPMVTDQPEIAQLIAALDDVDVSGPLLQAVLISQPANLFAQHVPVQTEPLGPWTYGLLADISDGRTQTGVIAMAFVDAASAARAVETLGRVWAGYTSLLTAAPMADSFPAAPVITVSASHDRIALFSITQPIETQQFDRWHTTVYTQLLEIIISGDASFLRPN